MRVLIVSEDPAERQRAATALAIESDVEILEATSAAETRLELGRGSVDVLVIDGDLTPKGGFSMLYELRADADLSSGRHLPALVMVQRSTDTWLAQWARADDTVAKPVDPFVVARKVRDLAAASTTEPA